LTELDRADREPTLVTEARVAHIKGKIATVKAQMRQLKQIGQQMSKAPDGKISLTDPDARSMATSGRGTGMVGYNVQTAVDCKHHLIVAHEVTNVGHDRDQLSSMAQKAREAIGRDEGNSTKPIFATSRPGMSIDARPVNEPSGVSRPSKMA
jgi:hypothetical protein